MSEEIVVGTDVWPTAVPGEPEEEQSAVGVCAMCGSVIQVPLGPHIVGGQCECGTHFWISEPDGDDFNVVCDLIGQTLEEKVFIFQSDPVEQYLAGLAERGHCQKVRDERFDKKELVAEYGEQKWMLGYVCFLKLDPPPTIEMFR